MKGKTLFSLCLLTCLLCSCQLEDSEYVILYGDLEASLNYMNINGASISQWEGIYSFIETTYTYEDQTGVVPSKSYTSSEIINAKEIDSICQGVDQITYRYLNGSSYIVSDFYDGNAWYQLRDDGYIYMNTTNKLDISYFSWAVDQIVSISDYFIELTSMVSLLTLEEEGYLIDGCVYQSNIDETIYVDVKVDYNDSNSIAKGSIEMRTTYDSEVNLILFTYTMDDITIIDTNTIVTTSRTLTAYEYLGDIDVPIWLLPYY